MLPILNPLWALMGVCGPHQVVKESDIIFVAVKPQYVEPVLKEVRGHLTDRHTIVSIAAGKTLASLKVRLRSFYDGGRAN